jgi:hypothetical protein
MYEKFFDHGIKIVKVAKGGKNPLGDAWQDRYAKTPEEVEGWVADGYNIGMILSAQDSVVDVEIDSPEAEEAWNRLGIECYTPTFSGKRGNHRLFRITDEQKELIPLKTVVKPYGIEFRIGNLVKDGRTLACQSVCPPSIHETGHQYAWLPECSLEDYDEIAPLPDELFQILIDESTWETSVGTRGKSGHVVEAGKYNLTRDGASEGGRNNALWNHQFKKFMELEYNLSEMDKDVQDILKKELHVENKKYCEPPLDNDEVDKVFNNSLRTAKERQQKEREEFNIFDDEKKVTKQKEGENSVKSNADMVARKTSDYHGAIEKKEELEKRVAELEAEGISLKEAQGMDERQLSASPKHRETRKAAKEAGTVTRNLGKMQHELERAEKRLSAAKDKLKHTKAERGCVDGVNGEFEFYGNMGLTVTKEVLENRDWELDIIKSQPPSFRLRIPSLSAELAATGGVVLLTQEDLQSASNVAKAILSYTGYVEINENKNLWEKIWSGNTRVRGIKSQLLSERRLVQPISAGESTHVQAALKVLEVLSNAVTNEHVDSPADNGSPIWRKDRTLWFSWDYVWEKAAHRTTLTRKDGIDLKDRLLNRLEKSDFDGGEFKHTRHGITTQYVIWKRESEYAALIAITKEKPDVAP